MFDVSCPALDHHRVRFLMPLLALLLCGCPKLWGPCPGGVLNTLSLTDGEMVMGDETGSDVNWGDVEKLNLEKCTEVRGSLFLFGHVRGLQKFSNIRNITGTIWFFDVRVDPPGLVEIFPALETLGGINATEARSSMEVFSGFRALRKTGNLDLMGLGTSRVEGFEMLEEMGDLSLRGSVLPSLRALRSAGNLTIRGGGGPTGDFASLQTAGAIDIESLSSDRVDLPLLTTAASLRIAASDDVGAIRLQLVEHLSYLQVSGGQRLTELTATSLRTVDGSVGISWTGLQSLGGLQRLESVAGDLRIVGNLTLPEAEINTFVARIRVGGETYVRFNEARTACPVP